MFFRNITLVLIALSAITGYSRPKILARIKNTGWHCIPAVGLIKHEKYSSAIKKDSFFYSFINNPSSCINEIAELYARQIEHRTFKKTTSDLSFNSFYLALDNEYFKNASQSIFFKKNGSRPVLLTWKSLRKKFPISIPSSLSHSDNKSCKIYKLAKEYLLSRKSSLLKAELNKSWLNKFQTACLNIFTSRNSLFSSPVDNSKWATEMTPLVKTNSHNHNFTQIDQGLEEAYIAAIENWINK